MWIAKPLRALSDAERSAWMEIHKSFDSSDLRESDAPLSQTLAWAEAIHSSGGQAYLVFSPDERVGGIVHRLSSSSAAFECINGPSLRWDDAASAPRQLATFAMAVAQLSPDFSSLRIQPRWRSADLEKRCRHLPIEPREILSAATVHVPVRSSWDEQLKSVSPRLRRSVTAALRAGVQARTRRISSEEIESFVEGARRFGQCKGFFVPDAEWLKSLMSPGSASNLEFWLTEARIEGASTQLLICVRERVAHYLMGFDERAKSVPASLSTAAAAHLDVLKECAERGVGVYDLNGFTDPNDAEHPYAGVSRFKAQFRGEAIQYASPVFQIEA